MSLFINGVDRTPVNSLALLNAASGNEVANRIDWTVNKAAGNDTGLVLNKTDTLSGGTTNLLIDAQRNGTSVLILGHKGRIVQTSTLEAATGNEVAYTLNYTVNKLTSGNSTGLVINGTLTAAPGTNLLTDWQIAGASKANITYLGGAYFAGNVGIGTTSPDRLLHAEYASALTNTIQQVARLSHITSGTPANGIGLGLEFEQETSNNNNEIIATIEAVTTDVTAASEDADLVFKTMAAGAAANEKLRVRSTGTCGYSPVDNAGSPVSPTNPVNTFFYNASKADDAVITCPAITTSAYGVVILGDAEEYARFIINSTGTVTLLDNSANVVSNSDVDGKMCVGTGATQEPLQIKNRMGSSKTINCMIWYD